MLFNSLQYLLFLPLVVAAFWIAPKPARTAILLLASYYFYMSWMPAYGLLLAGLTAWNYIFGIAIPRQQNASTKRLLLVAALAGNLACLALYKYTNFLIETFWSLGKETAALAHKAAFPGDAPLLPIILPLGISFFVFEFIHYIVDVYKGEKPIANVLRFSLFAAFFPSQIAGPIKRFEDFDQQVVAARSFDKALFQSGVWLIIEGMFKKVVLGDNLAQLVQPAFQHAASIGAADAWIGVVAFTLQIYYDFSGYTDIGRGSAMLLGYRLPENFNMPYIARDIAEFWHRWHISLSTWLRDYLYIPLGGSKKGPAKQSRNLLITMFLGGLWHGASWHYVVWGLFQGVALVVAHSWKKLTGSDAAIVRVKNSTAYGLAANAVTLLAVMVGWVVFRADDMNQALSMYASMLGLHSNASALDQSLFAQFVHSVLPVGLTVYVVAQLAKRNFGSVSARLPQMVHQLLLPSPVVQATLACACALVIYGLAPHKAVPFIYFQF